MPSSSGSRHERHLAQRYAREVRPHLAPAVFQPATERLAWLPAHLAVMLPAHMKAEIVRAAEGTTQGDVVRRRLALGRDLADAYWIGPELERRIEELRQGSATTTADTLRTLLDFAVREIERRTKRNAELAAGVARTFAETTGVMLDGVDVGNVSISAER